MREYGSLPRARQNGLLEEVVGEELLLYDQNSHTAHCLSPIAACVWRHCDGARDLAELAVVSGVSEDLVADALHELRETDLLDAELEPTQSTVRGESRREAIGRVARYGTAAVAGSMIVSATAATPAMASSGELEVVEGENVMCEGPAIGNCCLCVGLCLSSRTAGFPNETQCRNDCAFYERAFVSWHPNMQCKP
jgi:hypothetical protein